MILLWEAIVEAPRRLVIKGGYESSRLPDNLTDVYVRIHIGSYTPPADAGMLLWTQGYG